MSKLIVAAATTAAVLAGVAGANAVEQAGGWVTSFDGTRLTLLNDPNVYIVAPSVDTSNVEQMRTAYLTFDVVNGQRLVSGLVVPEHWYVEEPEDDDDDES